MEALAPMTLTTAVDVTATQHDVSTHDDELEQYERFSLTN